MKCHMQLDIVLFHFISISLASFVLRIKYCAFFSFIMKCDAILPHNTSVCAFRAFVRSFVILNRYISFEISLILSAASISNITKYFREAIIVSKREFKIYCLLHVFRSIYCITSACDCVALNIRCVVLFGRNQGAKCACGAIVVWISINGPATNDCTK